MCRNVHRPVPKFGMHRYRVRYCAHVLVLIKLLRYNAPITIYLLRSVLWSVARAGGGGAMSAVWRYFKVNDEDKSRAECKLCSAKVSRGGEKSCSFNTSNLIKHLKNQHGAEYKEFANQPTATTNFETNAGEVRENVRRQSTGCKNNRSSYPVHCS